MKNLFLDNIWIAIAHVKPRAGFENILALPNAYLTIVGKANDIKEFKLLAQKTFFNEGFILQEELENIELLSDRLKKTDLKQSILDLVDCINEVYPVQFDTFHSYPEEDEPQ
jgi:hypothetical protein